MNKSGFSPLRRALALLLACAAVLCLLLPASAQTGGCPLLEHEHSEGCYASADSQTLVCGLEEHTHSAACLAQLTQQEKDEAAAVAARIEALPSQEEISQTLEQYEQAGDEEAMEDYYFNLLFALQTLSEDYNALSDTQKAAVPNREKLLLLLSLTQGEELLVSERSVTYQAWNGYDWEEIGRSAYRTGTVDGETRAYVTGNMAASFFAAYGYDVNDGTENLTYSYNDIYTIFYVNDTTVTDYCFDLQSNKCENGTPIQLYQYNPDAHAQQFRLIEVDGYQTLSPLDGSGYYVNVYGDTVESGTKLALYDQPDANSQWKLITTEKGRTKFAARGGSENYLIDLPDGKQESKTQLQIWKNGTAVLWQLVQRYDEQPVVREVKADGTVLLGLTQESNGSIVCRYIPKQSGAGTLETVVGADTRNIIEINLYDYSDNINENWSKNKKYPGFQQDGGTTRDSTALHGSFFNYGNNITTDIAAKTDVTEEGAVGINRLAEDRANRPISGAMYPRLKDDYPALSDGTSLAYLFSQNQYAKKLNEQSINGLFQYNVETGAYTFNSRRNHAQFNSADDTFTLYKQIITSNFMMYPFGNFLPLNNIEAECKRSSDIDRSYLNTIVSRTSSKTGIYKTLSDRLKQFVSLMDARVGNQNWNAGDCINAYFSVAGIGKTFTKDQLTNLYTIDYDKATNFFFGMEMKMNFIQPLNGLTGTDRQQPMVFYFSGDDDVWVYIDDLLFLDLSGIHRHVGGEIDFTKGEVRYYALEKATGDVSGVPYETVPFSAIVDAGQLNENGTFRNFSSHSFHFYYMERGAGSGVCRMNFNFPLLRENSITVSKELTTDVAVLGNPDYKFQVLKAEDATSYLPAGTSFERLDAAGNSIGTDTLDATGIFTLKAGQTAVFSDIEEDSGEYFVRELLEPEVYPQYGSIMVGGTTATTSDNILVGSDSFKGADSPKKSIADGDTVFSFNNHVDAANLGTLVLSKIMGDNLTDASQKSFTFEVKLDGELLPVGTTYLVGQETRTVTQAGQITLRPGETAELTNVLAGSRYEIAELPAAGYLPSYGGGNSGMMTAAKRATVAVTNSSTGTRLSIPVEKTFSGILARTESFHFVLEDRDGQELQQQEITLDTGQTASTAFTLTYLEEEFSAFPTTLVYTICELDEGKGLITYDKTSYTLTVTVDQGTDGRLTASYSLGDGRTVAAFTNHITGYSLPETGGSGTGWFTAAGAALSLAAAGILCGRRRKKETRA